MAAARPTRRWFSYSLRSLLALVTLAAVVLGWIAYERRQSRSELQLAEGLKASYQDVEVQLGGRFDPKDWYFKDTVEEPAWWRRALSDIYGPRVQFLYVADKGPAADLPPLAELKSLVDLRLRHTPTRDLTALAALSSLRHLDIHYAPVSDISASQNSGTSAGCTSTTPPSRTSPRCSV